MILLRTKCACMLPLFFFLVFFGMVTGPRTYRYPVITDFDVPYERKHTIWDSKCTAYRSFFLPRPPSALLALHPLLLLGCILLVWFHCVRNVGVFLFIVVVPSLLSFILHHGCWCSMINADVDACYDSPKLTFCIYIYTTLFNSPGEREITARKAPQTTVALFLDVNPLCYTNSK